MNSKSLKKSIHAFLTHSMVNPYTSASLRLLLPSMSEENLRKVYESLKREHHLLREISEQQKRLMLKYEVMVEKMNQKPGGA